MDDSEDSLKFPKTRFAVLTLIILFALGLFFFSVKNPNTLKNLWSDKPIVTTRERPENDKQPIPGLTYYVRKDTPVYENIDDNSAAAVILARGSSVSGKLYPRDGKNSNQFLKLDNDKGFIKIEDLSRKSRPYLESYSGKISLAENYAYEEPELTAKKIKIKKRSHLINIGYTQGDDYFQEVLIDNQSIGYVKIDDFLDHKKYGNFYYFEFLYKMMAFKQINDYSEEIEINKKVYFDNKGYLPIISADLYVDDAGDGGYTFSMSENADTIKLLVEKSSINRLMPYKNKSAACRWILRDVPERSEKYGIVKSEFSTSLC